MSGLDKPTLKELNASSQPGCKCVECAIDYGDQAFDASEKEIARLTESLRIANEGWEAANEQCVDFEMMSKIIESDDMLSTALNTLSVLRASLAAMTGLYDAKNKEVAAMVSEANRWKKKAIKSAACQSCMTALERPL